MGTVKDGVHRWEWNARARLGLGRQMVFLEIYFSSPPPRHITKRSQPSALFLPAKETVPMDATCPLLEHSRTSFLSPVLPSNHWAKGNTTWNPKTKGKKRGIPPRPTPPHLAGRRDKADAEKHRGPWRRQGEHEERPHDSRARSLSTALLHPLPRAGPSLSSSRSRFAPARDVTAASNTPSRSGHAPR